MEAVFLHFVKVGVSAEWAILAVLLFRFILREAPKWTHCLLWAMVGLRLLVPVFIPNPVRLPVVHTLRESVEGAVLQLSAAVDTTGENAASYLSVLGWIWLGGLLLLLAYGGISYLLVRRRASVSAKYAEQIYLCDDITAPFILGVFRPRICLPSGIEAEQIPYVVRHEQAHLQRKDHWWKPLSFLLLAVYWFHPLIWLAYVILNRDIELACDEKSIREMAALDKKRYSDALVNCSMQRRKLLVCPVGFGELNVRERIGSVFSYRRSTRWHTVLAVALCLPLTLCFLGRPTLESSTKNDIPIADTVKEELPGLVVSEWADGISIDINANGISVEKMKCCPYVEDVGVELFYSLSPEDSVYTTCKAKRLSHIHEYGDIYTTIKCKNCGTVVDAYYAGKGYRCPYEAQFTE